MQGMRDIGLDSRLQFFTFEALIFVIGGECAEWHGVEPNDRL